MPAGRTKNLKSFRFFKNLAVLIPAMLRILIVKVLPTTPFGVRLGKMSRTAGSRPGPSHRLQKCWLRMSLWTGKTTQWRTGPGHWWLPEETRCSRGVTWRPSLLVDRKVAKRAVARKFLLVLNIRTLTCTKKLCRFYTKIMTSYKSIPSAYLRHVMTAWLMIFAYNDTSWLHSTSWPHEAHDAKKSLLTTPLRMWFYGGDGPTVDITPSVLRN